MTGCMRICTRYSSSKSTLDVVAWMDLNTDWHAGVFFTMGREPRP